VKTTLLKTLLPWLCYAVLSFLGWHKSAAPVALLVLTLSCLILGTGFKPVDLVLIVYFSAVALGVGLLHWSWLSSIQPVAAPAMLAIMALVTLLLRQPFTLPYARESVKDPAMWDNPHFYRVNYILSILWGSAFLLAALGQAWALYQPKMLWFVTLSAFLVTGLVGWTTYWFPPWYRKRFYTPELAQSELIE
jgi:hypothetical protein